jgi:hypothetical protein
MAYFAVLYHTLSAMWYVRSDAAKSSWWIPLFWRHHRSSSPASVWEGWWKDEPYLSRFHCIAFTGLDGTLFCPPLWETSALLLYSLEPEQSQHVPQEMLVSTWKATQYQNPELHNQKSASSAVCALDMWYVLWFVWKCCRNKTGCSEVGKLNGYISKSIKSWKVMWIRNVICVHFCVLTV